MNARSRPKNKAISEINVLYSELMCVCIVGYVRDNVC